MKTNVQLPAQMDTMLTPQPTPVTLVITHVKLVLDQLPITVKLVTNQDSYMSTDVLKPVQKPSTDKKAPENVNHVTTPVKLVMVETTTIVSPVTKENISITEDVEDHVHQEPTEMMKPKNVLLVPTHVLNVPNHLLTVLLVLKDTSYKITNVLNHVQPDNSKTFSSDNVKIVHKLVKLVSHYMKEQLENVQYVTPMLIVITDNSVVHT
jgi:hypothetical protein